MRSAYRPAASHATGLPRRAGQVFQALSWLALCGALDHLNAVAERITKLDPVQTGKGSTVEDLDPRRFEPPPPRGKLAHLIGDVGLATVPLDAVLCADVDLPVAYCEPEATATLENLRLGEPEGACRPGEAQDRSAPAGTPSGVLCPCR